MQRPQQLGRRVRVQRRAPRAPPAPRPPAPPAPPAAAPATGRGPSSSVSSRSCTSARHGRPAAVISAAASAPEDSAASSSPAGRAGRGVDRGLLPARLGDRVQPVSGVLEREERRSRRRDRLQRGPPGVTRPAPVGQRRPAEHRGAQPQVGAPLHPHAGREQRRVPAGRAVPHPPDPGTAGADVLGQRGAGQPGGRAGRTVGGELDGLDVVRAATAEDHPAHPGSVPQGSDGTRGAAGGGSAGGELHGSGQEPLPGRRGVHVVLVAPGRRRCCCRRRWPRRPGGTRRTRWPPSRRG